MQTPRRFLPSMSLLMAFEAAARRESFTAAAAELNLTQSAVSRQIRALEESLGAELFHRERQTVKLTFAGKAYAREIGEALKRISTATLGFRASPEGGALTLAVLPLFGTRWLTPRLPGFLAAHPGVIVHFETRLGPFDFATDTVDGAIHYGAPDWAGAELTLLMHERVVPACSPALLERFAFREPADLRQAPLLHLTSRPDAWERWLAANGAASDSVHGMLVDQFVFALQAAVAGLGIALLPEMLIAPELARGELVAAIERPAMTTGAYYLAWPATREGHRPLAEFRRWIVAESRSERAGAITPG